MLISGDLCLYSFSWAAMEGRTLARAMVILDAVSLRVMLAWPTGMQAMSTRP